MENKSYFDVISIDKSYRTVWDIYEVNNVDDSVGMVVLSYDSDENPKIYAYDDRNGESQYCKSLKEAFSIWGITSWDRPLY